MKYTPRPGKSCCVYQLARERASGLSAAGERIGDGMAPATMTLDQEINPWEAQSARFDFAARKLNLDEGLWKLLQDAVARNYRSFSCDHG